MTRRKKEEPAALFAPAAVSTVRRVVVPLPFSAARVTFDEQTRDLSPAASIVAFDRNTGAEKWKVESSRPTRWRSSRPATTRRSARSSAW